MKSLPPRLFENLQALKRYNTDFTLRLELDHTVEDSDVVYRGNVLKMAHKCKKMLIKLLTSITIVILFITNVVKDWGKRSSIYQKKRLNPYFSIKLP